MLRNTVGEAKVEVFLDTGATGALVLPLALAEKQPPAAAAHVVRAGATLGYVECEVKDERGRLVAKAASTCLKVQAT